MPKGADGQPDSIPLDFILSNVINNNIQLA